MPTTPYVTVKASVNSGALQSGGINISDGDSVQLSLESTVGITTCLWEVYDYPEGASTPSGWTLDAAAERWYVTTSAPHTPTAIDFTGGTPGRYLFRATGNNGIKGGAWSVEMVDEATAVSLPFANGLHSLGARETTQFDSRRAWAKPVQDAIKAVGNGVNNVKSPPFNATGDGVTDDTAAIQAAIASVSSGGTLAFPPGTYQYAPGTTSTFLSKSDITIDIQSGATINITGSGNFYAFYFNLCDRVRVVGGGKIVGRAATIGILLRFDGCRGALVEGPELDATGAGCDAIYITRATSRQAIDHIVRANITGAGRNGISLVSCSGIEISGSIRNVDGNAPEAGLQVEPNVAGTDEVTGLSISALNVADCDGNGIALSGLLGSNQALWGISGVTIDGLTTSGCGSSAVDGTDAGLRISVARDVIVSSHTSDTDRIGAYITYADGVRYRGTIRDAVLYGYRLRHTRGGDVYAAVTGTGSHGALIANYVSGVKLRGEFRDIGSASHDGVNLGANTSECDVKVLVRNAARYGVKNSGASHTIDQCDLRNAGGTANLFDDGYGTKTPVGNLTDSGFVAEDLSTWTGSEATPAGSATDPFGGTGAYTITDSVNNTDHYIYTQPTGIDDSADAIVELYALAGTVEQIQVSLDSGSNLIVATLTNGTITGTTQAQASGAIGDSWYQYRAVIPAASISAAGASTARIYTSSGGSTTYAGAPGSCTVYGFRVSQ